VIAGPDVAWVREWRRPDGGGCFRLGREGQKLIADWEGCGTLRASPTGDDVEVTPRADLTPTDADKWSRGPVRALLRHLEGRPTLHASAVAIDDRAMLFLGDSGAGKSTMAAFCCLKGGASLLADDLAEIEVVDGNLRVNPTDDGHWLRDDTAIALGRPRRCDAAKERVAAPRASPEPVRLAAIVALTFAEVERPTVSPVRGEEAFAVLNAGYVRFIVDDAQVHLRDLEIMSMIAAAVPVVRLARSRSLAAVELTVAAVRDIHHAGLGGR
jgi:hypothetical protein